MIILNSWTCKVSNIWLCCTGLIVGIITVVFVLSCDKDKLRNMIISISAMALTAFLIIAGVVIFPRGTITEYKVFFDDSIPITEFLEKYEIVDQEGLIFTIKDKEITK